MFNENFLKSVRNKKDVTDHINPNWGYDMYDFVSYMSSHPQKFINWDPESRRVILEKIEERSSTPDFAKNIINELAKKFPKNKITCHAYCGFTADSKSFSIHKDSMDVFYLQVIGEINWSIWESDSKDTEITPHEGNCIFKEKFLPGDCIWIPRGTYHYIEPITARVGFSFGIENEPDPSTYV